MKVTRWPALIVFAALFFGAVIIDGSTDPEPTEEILQRSISSVVGEDSDLVSIWFCISGTVGGADIADHQIILGNKSINVAEVALTITPVLAPQLSASDSDENRLTPEIVQIETVLASIEVPPMSVHTVDLADVPKVAGEFAAVMLESNVGNLVVEHHVTGATGESQSNCQTDAADEWYFASGTTRDGSREIISIFNPFADSAVIDMTFVADGRVRRPDAFSGLVIPPRSLLPIDITGAVTLADVLSTSIKARNGRVVAERLMMFGDEFSPNGLNIETGTPSLAPIWVFPGGIDGSALSAIQIYNPSEIEEANVDIEIYSDFAYSSFIEPVSLTVSPASTETVVLGGEEPITVSRAAFALTSRIPLGAPHWLVVRSINGLPVASERFVLSDGSFPQTTSSGFGIDVAATSHTFISKGGDEQIAIAHPSNDRLTQVKLFAYSDGQVYESFPFEISAVSRKVIDLEQFGIPSNSVIQIDSSEAVLVERHIGSDQGGYWTRVTPHASSVMEPRIPIQEGG
ncbi:MAG: hypothetical protein CL470_07765 [Acidimicrobiaceae bacterium]|nr:hypothetical protein [Acidimicrobiaceae bacterium]